MATMEVKFSPEDLKAAQSAERIPEPTIVVIFGASGDLTKRKLLPALFHLEQSGLLPSEFTVVGVARRPLQDEFAKDMREGILQFGGVKEGDTKLDEFMQKVSYHAMNFDDPEGYGKLKTLLESIDQKQGYQGKQAVLSGDGAGILCRHYPAAGRAWNGETAEGHGAHHHREALWPRPGFGEGIERRSKPCLSPKTRSSVSITTWARKRCRTS